MNQNKILYGVIVVVAMVIAFLFGQGFGGGDTTYVQGISAASTTNSSAKMYTLTVAPSTAAATTSSLLNTDGTDRGIIGAVAFCTSVGTSQTFSTGAGLTSWTLQAATGTTPGLGLQGNTNYAVNFTLGTTTSNSFTGTTTQTFYSYVQGIWPTGTYLHWLFNATNTAACTVGVSTISL